MPNCSIVGCTSKSGHLFPKNNPSLKRKWLKFAGLKEYEINQYSLICKVHFAENAFDQHVPVPGLPPPRKRLKPNAVPTLFPSQSYQSSNPLIVPRKKPSNVERVLYNVPARSSPNSRIRFEEVDFSRAMVFSEEQLARVIERIREKLIRNAHPSAVFPKKWKTAHLFVGTPKIREGFPPFSMPCLAALAIEANPKRMATPSQIVGFISQNFPCYKLTDPRWHGKVFDTLETYRLFQKVPSSQTDNPSKTYYHFVPDPKTVMSSKVYDAFTDPFFDDSKIDPLRAVISSDGDIMSVISSEDLEESRADDFADDFGLVLSEDQVGSVCGDVTAEDCESSDSHGATVMIKEQIPGSSSDEESVTFFECSYCTFVALSSKTVSVHVSQKHRNGQNYCCTRCSFVTLKEDELKAHKASHKN